MEETLVKRSLDNYVSLKRYYTPDEGIFNNMILNHYLHYHPWNADKGIIVKPVKTDLRPGKITQDPVEGLLITASYKDNMILTTMYNNTQGHAVTF